MSIRVEDAQGNVGTLDVAKLIAEEMEGVIVGAQGGMVSFRTPEGDLKKFGLANWAQENQMTIVQMEGFNGPDTALDQPPVGMNYMDQSAFYHDGMDMKALGELFPKNLKRSDGRVVVLDSDGLWKTMWSPLLVAPLPPPTFQEQVATNMVNDPRVVLRGAGVAFLLSLAGLEVKNDSKGMLKLGLIEKTFEFLARNAPYENKFQLGKITLQTLGLDPWKLHNALLDTKETIKWLKYALDKTNFQYRMKQAELAEIVVHGMRAQAQKEFILGMRQLVKLPETKKMVINLKVLFAEFIQFLVGMDLLRDISKTTGLNEWISMNEDTGLDKSKLPPMPEFVSRFVHLLRWMLPIVKDNTLAFARGKNGFKSIIAMMAMLDECIYSLAGVPDSSAKYKMFMALKRLQTQIESKLSFIYQPNPEDNKDGMKENPFMQVKQYYSPRREELYRICQLPKESWNNSLLQSLRSVPNLEQFYDNMHPVMAGIMKSFAAMDAAYDIQPWVDPNHAERTHDAFSQHQESFGLPPPEAGFLAKNSPRAVQNISETLVESSGIILAMPEEQRVHIVRTPYLLAQLLKTIMVASINRELGTVEIMSKFGMNSMDDKMASPDPARIWEDPEVVQRDIDTQVQELMGSMAMEAMMQQQSQQNEESKEQMVAEQMRDEGEVPKAGAGPMGSPQRAAPMRR